MEGKLFRMDGKRVVVAGYYKIRHFSGRPVPTRIYIHQGLHAVF